MNVCRSLYLPILHGQTNVSGSLQMYLPFFCTMIHFQFQANVSVLPIYQILVDIFLHFQFHC